jgi:hypothetical protein
MSSPNFHFLHLAFQGCTQRITALSVYWLLLPTAQALEGSGFGATAEEARLRATADLASSVQVQVRAEVESCTRVSGKRVEDCGSRVMQRTATELPLLGLRLQDFPGEREAFGARAMLEPSVAVPLYRARLAGLEAELAAAQTELARQPERGGDTRQAYRLLNQMLTLLQRHAEARLVALALGLEACPLALTVTELEARRTALEVRADSLTLAAQILLREPGGPVLRVEPVATAGTHEITELASAVTDALKLAAQPMQNPSSKANGPANSGLARALIVTGELRPLPDQGQGIEQNLQIEIRAARVEGAGASASEGGELLGLRSIRLSTKATAGLNATPLAPNFERLLRDGMLVSGELRAELQTQAGQRNLLFRKGEEVRLIARLNRAGYFYVVGHVLHSDGRQLSYLLPLQDDASSLDRAGRFVRYVAPTDANHFLDLGGFEIASPYGQEHLQIFASSEPPGAVLPDTQFDAVSGYDVIIGSTGSVQAGLEKARALKRKQAAGVQQAEASLSFTTRER